MILKCIGYTLALSIFPCVFMVLRKHESLKNAELCEGAVVGHDRRSDSDGDTFALQIRYRDPAGAVHDFTTKSSSSPASRDIGEKVVVFHHSQGAGADVLVFEHLYLYYWIWFCIAVAVAGCVFAPHLLKDLYMP